MRNDWTNFDLRELHALPADRVEPVLASLRRWAEAEGAGAADRDGPDGLTYFLRSAEDLARVPPSRRDSCFDALRQWVGIVRLARENPRELTVRIMEAGGVPLPRLLAFLGRTRVVPESMIGQGFHWVDDGRTDARLSGTVSLGEPGEPGRRIGSFDVALEPEDEPAPAPGMR